MRAEDTLSRGPFLSPDGTSADVPSSCRPGVSALFLGPISSASGDVVTSIGRPERYSPPASKSVSPTARRCMVHPGESMRSRRDGRSVAHVCTVDLTARLLLLPQLIGLRDDGWTVSVVCAPGPGVAELEREGIRHVPWPSATRSWDPRADARAFVRARAHLPGGALRRRAYPQPEARRVGAHRRAHRSRAPRDQHRARLLRGAGRSASLVSFPS